MPRNPKKIRFSMDDYKSETVFAKSSMKGKSKKKKKSVSTDDNYEPSGDIYQRLKSRVSTPYKMKNPRKRKIVISYSNDSFQEDLTDTISPSKSETSRFSNSNISNSIKREPSIVVISSDSEESNNSFSFINFFDTRDHSLNESITEAHSGIDYEFISNGIRKVKICGKQVFNVESNNSLDIEKITMSEESTDSRNVEDEFESKKTASNTEASAQVDQSEWISNSTEKCSTSNLHNNSQHIENIFVEEYVPSDSLTNNISSNQSSESIHKHPEPQKTTKKKVANYHEIKEEQLVLLRENCSLPFFGMFTVKVLQGTIEVLGCVIDKNSEEISLYSPRGSALLVVKNVTVAGKGGAMNEKFSNFKDEHFKELAEKETTAIFKYTKVDDGCLKCTEKYISQQIFPKLNDSQAPQVIFEPEGNWNVVSQSPLWDEVLSWVIGSTKLLVTGGKGVGKSTFIKYSINRLLNKYKIIRVIDLDPGQPEFTVPGCISVLTITEPICGPNYTHLRKAQRSYMSNINVGHDPSKYLKSIELLMMELKLDTQQNIPTLINYMGFTQGIGLSLVSSTISYVLPTDVVQISSKAYEKNFKKLSMKTVTENCFPLRGDLSCINFKLHELTSMNDSNSGWILKPRQIREMCVLSYLGQMIPESISSLKSCELPIYEIGLDLIKIVDAGKSEISPAAVNANLVALCSDAFHCMGYGIVRGIDLISQTLMLMTPESPDVLEDVFYLVMTVVQFPPSVYMIPDEITGHIPYVMEGEFVSLEKITKRSYVPVNKK